jgi:hypothetical protein
MKIQIILCALAILCASLMGCGSVSSVKPLCSGYEEVTYTQNSISEPSAHRISLQFRKADGGRIIIWPSLDSGVIFNNDTAVFDGVMSNYESRLFAVNAPDLPMDITSAVLWRWSQQSGTDFGKLFKKARVVCQKREDNGV